LRALGKSSLYVAALFLGRAIVLDWSAAAGLSAGRMLARQLSRMVHELSIPAASLAPPRELLL